MGGKTFEKLSWGGCLPRRGPLPLATIDTIPFCRAIHYRPRRILSNRTVQKVGEDGGTTVFMFRSGIVPFASEILLEILLFN